MPVVIVKTLYTFVFIVKTIGCLWSSLRPSTLCVHRQYHCVSVNVTKILNKVYILKTIDVVVVLAPMVVVIARDPHQS